MLFCRSDGRLTLYMGGSRGGGELTGGPDPPLKNHKNIGFPNNIDLDTLKFTKLPSLHSIVGHYRHASEAPVQWRFAGGPMMAHFEWHFDPLSIPSTKKTKKKNPVNLTKLSGSAHDHRNAF